MDENQQKIEELAAIVQAVKDRVRSRYPDPGDTAHPIALPDLLAIVHARDAAQAKMAAIGSVNPRRGGPVNSLIQSIKRLISRGLGWFVRDQVTFNRETIACVEAILESLNDANRTFLALSGLLDEKSRDFGGKARELGAKAEDLTQISAHVRAWHDQWELKIGANEAQLLRGLAETQHCATQIEEHSRELMKSQHADFRGELERGLSEIQKKLWADMEKVRLEYERLIHNELRVVRQRGAGISPPPPPNVAAVPNPPFDYQRFADRFRGSEDSVRDKLRFYVPYFEDRREVLDIGCGRGEFLELVKGRGIDFSEESVAYCRSKGLPTEVADLFPYLASLADSSLDAIFSAQVIEHLPPERIPEMVRLCAEKLSRGGILAIETPNPECLAIFATHFYLDPTHTRPLPPSLMVFYLEEAGFGRIEVHPLSPAIETMPEVGQLPEAFRNRFFGGLDYAIIGTKL